MGDDRQGNPIRVAFHFESEKDFLEAAEQSERNGERFRLLWSTLAEGGMYPEFPKHDSFLCAVGKMFRV